MATQFKGLMYLTATVGLGYVLYKNAGFDGDANKQKPRSEFDDLRQQVEILKAGGGDSLKELKRATDKRRKELADAYAKAEYERVCRQQEEERRLKEEEEANRQEDQATKKARCMNIQ